MIRRNFFFWYPQEREYCLKYRWKRKRSGLFCFFYSTKSFGVRIYLLKKKNLGKKKKLWAASFTVWYFQSLVPPRICFDWSHWTSILGHALVPSPHKVDLFKGSIMYLMLRNKSSCSSVIILFNFYYSYHFQCPQILVYKYTRIGTIMNTGQEVVLVGHETFIMAIFFFFYNKVIHQFIKFKGV